MRTLLIIEDNEVVSGYLKIKLQKEKYVVVQASNGRDALELIKNREFDLIISDVMMPYMSGLEVLDYVRNDLNLNVPFIVLSVAGHEQMIVDAFNKGADDYITKPFSTLELMTRVKKALGYSIFK